MIIKEYQEFKPVQRALGLKGCRGLKRWPL